MNQVNKKIKDFREKQGFSRAELGRKLGSISGQLIGQYEKDIDPKMPGGEFFIKWKNAFGFDLLCTETEVSVVKEPTSQYAQATKEDLSYTLKKLADATDRHSIIDERNSRTMERLVYLLEIKMGVAKPLELADPDHSDAQSTIKSKKNK